MIFQSIFGNDNVRRAKAAVASGALLLDVRTPEEFAEMRIPGAVNVPLHLLEQQSAAIARQHRQVVVYCRSGGRSARAAKVLRDAGLEVFDIGPMSAWGA